LVKDLIDLDLRPIVVVNDGSDPSCRALFDRLAEMDDCHVVHHAVNLGKGRALKSGFNYCCLNFPQVSGIVTVDADGQHLSQDVRRVAEEFLRNPRSLVIGTRTFAKGTPLRSRVGNLATRYVFRVLVGGRISDTQSGLRCIPMDFVPELLRLEGERYEYEMNMLIAARKKRIGIREVEIATIYLENNRSSHFNPLIDSMKIYFLLLRFSFSSLLASSIDFVVFSTLFLVNHNILISLIAARLISGSVNFVVNKNLVFHSCERPALPLLKYFVLFVGLAVLSFFSIRELADLGMNVIAAKLVAETVLFFGSFTIQRDFVFVAPEPAPEG
ncbi:MAG TPA: bifunctional glycosyltransferase family 2/GtrA family protein, partial [Desulfuromonadales bacterium]|nr:bifunctional glycosyltransferase family 2/GtrA family protein [Desulfuromonadales bacterium]